MRISALAPWYGSNRLLAPVVAEALEGCRWVGIPFGGGMSELARITAPTIVVNDLHRHVINLARVIQTPETLRVLVHDLRRALFHPDELQSSQEWCRSNVPLGTADTTAAYHYFVSQWMARSGQAGTDGEFRGNLPVRWTSSGGDSSTRFRSAVKSLPEWSRIMRRCNFTTLDYREFLGRVRDEPEHGVYCDPPFPEVGDGYRHKFTEQDHVDLADWLRTFRHARTVIRYYDHPLIRRLYPDSLFTWRLLRGRNSRNNVTPEVLISKISTGSGRVWPVPQFHGGDT